MEIISTWQLNSIENNRFIVEQIDGLLTKPFCLFFEGDLGAGKTTFINSFTKILYNQEVQSPTYSIIIEYDNFIHADFYRINSADEIAFLDIGLYSKDKNALFFEWAYQFKDVIDDEISSDFNKYLVNLSKNNGARVLKISKIS